MINSENCIVKTIYDSLVSNLQSGHVNWASKVKHLLSEYGFAYVWDRPNSICVNAFLRIFKQKMIDVFHQSWLREVERSEVLTLYKEIKVLICYEPYLYICHTRSYRKALTQLRLSSHSLRIQTGRYGRNREERRERLCNVCNSGEIEDEFHFILKCKRYLIIRRRYIDVFSELVSCVYR